MIKVVLVGAGDRANEYSQYALKSPDKMKVVGIVDPDKIRTSIMKERYNVPDENCFNSVEDFVKRDKFADAVINGTMDHLHVQTSIPVLKKGYDMLLEKPFAVNSTELKELVDVVKETGRKVYICHVLRYTKFYSEIKKHLLTGDIGDVISIQLDEHVSYHHMAVSYVRGKWSSEKLCFAPMLLAKSCHDVDILLWMMKETEPLQVASFGSDFQFGKERKPEGAGSRCMKDCPYVENCIFSAKSNYLAFPRWGQYVWKCLEANKNLTPEQQAESLKTDNRYGRCVWDFERDGNVDHQAVVFNFKNGATGTFSMVGGCAKPERNIHIVGTLGEIKGTFDDSRYVVRKMSPATSALGYTETVYDLNVKGDMIGAAGGHGGGDEKLVYDFLDYLNGQEPSVSCATLEDSVISHRTVFKAMQSKYSGEIVKI